MKFLDRITSNSRNKNIVHGSFSGILSKGVSGVTGLIAIPIVLNVLGKSDYALWMVLVSIINWLQLSDFGLLNGIVNVLADSFAKKDIDKTKNLMYTGFICALWLAVIGTVLSIFAANFIPYDRMFNISGAVLLLTIKKSFIIICVLFFCGIPFTLVSKIAYAFQLNHYNNYAQIISSIINLGIVFVLSFIKPELHWWIFYSMLIPVVTSIILFIVIRSEFSNYFSFKKKLVFRKDLLKEIMNISIPLFFFQMGAMFVNNLANFVILHAGTLDMVADFNVIWRVQWFIYSTGAALTFSLYPAIREAFVKNELIWIKKAVNRAILVQGGYAILCCLPFLLFNGDKLIALWTKKNLSYPMGFYGWMLLVLYLVISSVVSVFSESLKLLDKIKVQIGIVTLNGLFLNLSLFLFIPLLAIKGVILSFVLGSSIALFLLIILYRNFLNSHKYA